MSKSAICTLFEGDYHHGVGALANSLHRSGFKGVLYAGHRGELPFWCGDRDSGRHLVGDGFQVVFVRVATSWHLTNFKPRFMRELWERHGEDWDHLFYFDPDIVVKAEWAEFEFWSSCGVAVVEDVLNGRIGRTHPLRFRWKQFASGRGRTARRESDQFVNGGFVGVSRRDRAFLDEWAGLIDEVLGAYGLDPAEFMHHRRGRAFPFLGVDQDALNLALLVAREEPSIAGPEAMDFVGNGYLMAHAIASPKPWRAGFVRCALKGVPPSWAAKQYWANVVAPIRLYPPGFLLWKRLEILLAVAICRFYRRGPL